MARWTFVLLLVACSIHAAISATANFNCNNDGVCDLTKETPLNCPVDCPTTSFTGTKLTLFNCAPIAQKRNSCKYNVQSLSHSEVVSIMPETAAPVSGIIFGYFKSAKNGDYTFRLHGANVGAQLFINDIIVVDSYFSYDTLDASGTVYLVESIINKFEIKFFSVSNNVRSIRFTATDPLYSDFDLSANLFYSQNTCFDGILDEQETNSSSPLHCKNDFDAALSATGTCGDGVCQEKVPHSCIQDCHSMVTKICPPLAAPSGHIPQGFWVSDDTLGDLISNQVVEHLPGMEHMMYGLYVESGDEALAPIFYFGYCSDVVSNIVQDVYRGSVYNLPKEAYAEPLPKCSYTSNSESFVSASSLKTSIAKTHGVEVSAGGGVNARIVSVQAEAAFSLDTSVSTAKELQQRRSGSVYKTEVLCTVSKVQLADQYTFHPVFIKDVTLATTVDMMVEVIKKYGTYFYKSAVLGGKLEQISVQDSEHESKRTEEESSMSASLSFSTTVSNPLYGSVTGTFDGSTDSAVTSEEQSEYESQSSSSKLKTRGGAPGSYSPKFESTSPTSFGDWASSVDLLPVPVEYQLMPIYEIIPSTWKVDNFSIQELYMNATEKYLASVLESISKESDLTWYTLFWFFEAISSTIYNDINLVLEDTQGLTVADVVVEDQFGPVASVGKLRLHTMGDYAPTSPLYFHFQAPRTENGINKLSLSSIGADLHSGLRTTRLLLHDTSEGTQYSFIQQKSDVFSEIRYDHDHITIHMAVYMITASGVDGVDVRPHMTVEVVLFGRKGIIQEIVKLDQQWPTSNIGGFKTVMLRIPKREKSIGQLLSIQIHQGLYKHIALDLGAPDGESKLPVWHIKDVWAAQTFCSKLLDEGHCNNANNSNEGVSFVYTSTNPPPLFVTELSTQEISFPLYSIRNQNRTANAKMEEFYHPMPTLTGRIDFRRGDNVLLEVKDITTEFPTTMYYAKDGKNDFQNDAIGNILLFDLPKGTKITLYDKPESEGLLNDDYLEIYVIQNLYSKREHNYVLNNSHLHEDYENGFVYVRGDSSGKDADNEIDYKTSTIKIESSRFEYEEWL